jgi:mRNA (guanine-N7-)-methyltransferase
MTTTYPTTPPTNKHDLICFESSSGGYYNLVSSIKFDSTNELFHNLMKESPTVQPHKIASLYSYADGPEYPGPLSRGLLILGTADRSLSVVRQIVDHNDGTLPDGVHQCTLAVQLADAKHYDRLEKRHQINSIEFAKLMRALRQQDLVAILGKDKYERFGILVPYPQSEHGDDKTVNDFAAQCYIGDVQDAKNFLISKSTSSSAQAAATTVPASNLWDNNDDNDGPTYKPNADDDDDGGGWKPTTPPVPPNDDYDDGPTYKPDGDDDDDGGGWKPTTPPVPPNDDYDDGPTYKPDGDDDDNGGGGWKPTTPPVPPNDDNGGASNNGYSAPWEDSAENEDGENNNSSSDAMPWETSKDDDDAGGGGGGSALMPWETQGDDSGGGGGFGNFSSDGPPRETSGDDDRNNSIFGGNKRSYNDMVNDNEDDDDKDTSAEQFHQNEGAAAADAFYSGLTRSLDTRADSYLYHMRAFNGWVKATQIAELDPVVTVNGKIQPKKPLRVLDLACGKGGDLTKWTLHSRSVRYYVGIDVARGSLKDAAIRAREMRKKKKLNQAIFSCADLGSDVPGRLKTKNSKYMQKLLTWKLEDEALLESGEPEFRMERGGGISPTDKFDVVSIQFAIHYMMQTGKRARRFFHTVSQLLEIGGNLIFTTIDARVIIQHMMNLGLNYHFEDGKEPEFSEVVVEAGAGACKIKFEPEIVKKIIDAQTDGSKGEDELFGLQYTFTLVEGSDHAAGVGDAVNLPEWLTPIPVLVALGKEAGLELEYAQNFHEFYDARKDPSDHAAAHHALFNMKVVNRNGTISKEEWSVSRLYAAMKFRKVRESSLDMGDGGTEEDGDDDDDEEEIAAKSEKKSKIEIDPAKAKKMYPMAMMKAKRAAGDKWNLFSREEKEELTQVELRKLVAQ